VDAELAAIIEEIVQLALANGHITQAQVPTLRRTLTTAAQTGNIDYLDRAAAAYEAPAETRRDFGDIPLISGALEGLFGGGGQPLGVLPENTLGIEGARTVQGPGGKTFIVGPDGKIIDEIAAGAAGAGVAPSLGNTIAENLYVALQRGQITPEEYDREIRALALTGKLSGGTAAGGFASTDLRDLQVAYQQGLISKEQYDTALQRSLLGAGGLGGGITPYQQAQLDLQREQLGLSRERFGQEKLQNQIQAARTAQPLTYLSLLRGAPQQYAGLGQFAPTLAQGGGGATVGGIPNMSANPGGGYGVDMSGGAQGGGVPMPPSMAAINQGEAIKPGGVFPEGTALRFEGPQAQRNLTPFELAANTEAREFQGVPAMDQEYQRALYRRGVGSGLRFSGYGGTLRG
jgi:hypothetical protein